MSATFCWEMKNECRKCVDKNNHAMMMNIIVKSNYCISSEMCLVAICLKTDRLAVIEKNKKQIDDVWARFQLLVALNANELMT